MEKSCGNCGILQHKVVLISGAHRAGGGGGGPAAPPPPEGKKKLKNF